MALPFSLGTMADTLLSGLDHHLGSGVTPNGNQRMPFNMCRSHLESMQSTTCPSSCAKPGHDLSHGAHALELVWLGVAAAILHLVVLVALEGSSCCSGSVGWVADACELLGGLFQGLGVGGGEHGRPGVLTQLVAQGDHIISGGNYLCAHGPAFGVINGLFALHPVILFDEHGEHLTADLVKVVAPGTLASLASFVLAAYIRKVRGQGEQHGGGQQVVAPVVCRPLKFGVEFEELLYHGARCRFSAVRHALLDQSLTLVGSLGDASVVVLDPMQVLDVRPNAMRVVVIVAAQPVLERGVGDVDHENGKGVLVAGLDGLLHACLLISRSHLLVIQLLGMLTSYSRMELVVEEDGVQFVLVEVQNVLDVALELEKLGPAVVGGLLGNSILEVIGHDAVDVRVYAARW
eukprot:5617200-Pleurochrysis_carterae.AAC.1